MASVSVLRVINGREQAQLVEMGTTQLNGNRKSSYQILYVCVIFF